MITRAAGYIHRLIDRMESAYITAQRDLAHNYRIRALDCLTVLRLLDHNKLYDELIERLEKCAKRYDS